MSKQRSLIDAIFSEDAERVEKLLAKGVDLNCAFNGMLPLVEAARIGNKNILSILITHGALVNQQDQQQGHTPLTVACFEGHGKIIDLLLAHGADVNVCCRGVFTPLTEAAVKPSKSRTTIISKLLNSGADPSRVFISEQGVAVSNVLMRACLTASPEVIELLIDAGAMVNQHLFFGTALTSAVSAQNVGVVEVLLRHGADPRLSVPQDPKLLEEAGKSPIELARMYGSKKIIAMLERQQIKGDIQD